MAPKLQSALHKFAKPWYKLRAVRVFRDETSLAASPKLWGAIQAALEESEYFILLSSPEAANSEWVKKEIDFWLANKSAQTLLIVVTDGNIQWESSTGDFAYSKSTALPDNLYKVFSEQPRYTDLRNAKAEKDLSLRNPQFHDAVADLSATLRGLPKDDIVGEDIRQHRITQRWEWAIGTAILTLAVIASISAYQFFIQRDSAVARGLATRAEVLVQQQGTLLDTASLLAVEAMKRSPSFEADRAIRKVLALLPERVVNMDCAGTGEVRMANFSANGKYLATLNDDKAIQVWDTNTGHKLSVIHATGALKFIFHPSRDHLVVLTPKETSIWDYKTGKPIVTLPIENIRDIAFSADGGYLASLDASKTIHLWDGANYKDSSRYNVSEEMSYIVMANDAAELIAWNNTQAEVFRSPGPPIQNLEFAFAGVPRFKYSPNGSYIAILMPLYDVSLIDLNTQQPLLFEERHWNVAFSGDGNIFSLASPERDASSYDLETCNRAGAYMEVGPRATFQRKYIHGRGSCRQFDSVHHDNSVNTVTLSYDGELLGTTSRDGTARVWETFRGREVLRLLEENEGIIHALAFSANGKFVSGRGPKTCRTWKSRGHRQVAALAHLGRSSVFDVSFSKNGSVVATIGQDETARIWKIPEGDEILNITVGGFLGRHAIILNSEGTQLIIDNQTI